MQGEEAQRQAKNFSSLTQRGSTCGGDLEGCWRDLCLSAA